MQSLNIIFTGQDRVELQTQEVGEPGPGEVLVQTSKTLISGGTEDICFSRRFEPGTHWERWVTYPFSPGYSLVGRVIYIGPGVEGVRLGARVGLRRPHQQYLIAPVDALYPIPDGVSDEDATWFGLACIVQNGVRRAEHSLGQDVAVIGLGQLGQLVVQYLRLQGARQVIAIDTIESRLQLAREHGATATIARSVADAQEELLQLTQGAGAHTVYDVTGSSPVFPSALRLLRRFGRLVLLGDTGTPSEQHLTGDVITKALHIVGAHDTNYPPTSTDHAYWSQPRMAELFFTYLQRGDMRVSNLVTDRYAPSEAAVAYSKLRDARDSVLGVIFDWTSILD